MGRTTGAFVWKTLSTVLPRWHLGRAGQSVPRVAKKGKPTLDPVRPSWVRTRRSDMLPVRNSLRNDSRATGFRKC
jgi:hypothetical protein